MLRRNYILFWSPRGRHPLSSFSAMSWKKTPWVDTQTMGKTGEWPPKPWEKSWENEAKAFLEARVLKCSSRSAACIANVTMGLSWNGGTLVHHHPFSRDFAWDFHGMFPKSGYMEVSKNQGTPSYHPCQFGIFPYKLFSYWGTPMTMETPIDVQWL